MKVYYAHCMALYDTEQEKEDVRVLISLGFEVVNPNSRQIKDRFYSDEGRCMSDMDFFCKVVGECDALAFRAVENLAITSGVVIEIKHAQKLNKPVFEIPTLPKCRFLSRAATCEYLRTGWLRDILY